MGEFGIDTGGDASKMAREKDDGGVGFAGNPCPLAVGDCVGNCELGRADCP